MFHPPPLLPPGFCSPSKTAWQLVAIQSWRFSPKGKPEEAATSVAWGQRLWAERTLTCPDTSTCSRGLSFRHPCPGSIPGKISTHLRAFLRNRFGRGEEKGEHWNKKASEQDKSCAQSSPGLPGASGQLLKSQGLTLPFEGHPSRSWIFCLGSLQIAIFRDSLPKLELDFWVFTHMDSSLNFKTFQILPKETLSTINKNKGLGFAEFSGASVFFLAQIKPKRL